MFKKIIAIMSITCFAIGGIVSDRSIYTINDYGITHAYNGSFWYDQGWVDFSPDALHTYTIKVYKKKKKKKKRMVCEQDRKILQLHRV